MDCCSGRSTAIHRETLTQQNNNNPFDLFNDCRYNPNVPCAGATPIAGPGQGYQPTYRLPTGQGFKPGEPTRVVCKLRVVMVKTRLREGETLAQPIPSSFF